MINQNEIISQWLRRDLTVSVCCVVYNHENFIHDTLKGFLNQKTNFPIEVLLHDDASTDGSTAIIKQYEKQYPKIIKPIYQVQNQFSKGIRPNIKFNLPRVEGAYVAFCDGDDYWSDPLKLQKQIDFLENNREFTGCAHNTKIITEKEIDDSLMITNYSKDTFFIDDFTRGEVYFHNSAMVFRNSTELKDAYALLERHNGDWFRLIAFSKFGPIKYLDEIMSVYRVHSKGIWSLLSAEEQKLKNLRAIISFNEIFNYEYESDFLNLFFDGLTDNSCSKKIFCNIDENEFSRFVAFFNKTKLEKNAHIHDLEYEINTKNSIIFEQKEII
jgi:glycosyltransferase involved in cell wall biosynthesis